VIEELSALQQQLRLERERSQANTHSTTEVDDLKRQLAEEKELRVRGEAEVLRLKKSLNQESQSRQEAEILIGRLHQSLNQESKDRQDAEMLMEAATKECSEALQIAEQRAVEWQNEISTMQTRVATLETQCISEGARRKEVEACLQQLQETFVQRIGERMAELEVNQGRFAKQQDLDQHDTAARLKMLMDVQMDLAANVGPPLPSPRYVDHSVAPLISPRYMEPQHFAPLRVQQTPLAGSAANGSTTYGYTNYQSTRRLL